MMPSTRGRSLLLLLQLFVLATLVSRATSSVAIRNWTARTMIVVTPNPGGTSEELEPNQWIEYTTTNGRSGLFTMANRKDDNVVTVPLLDGQVLALCDNISDMVDGILVDEQGRKIKTVFINL